MKNNYQKAAYELLNGKVVGFATETVMGLGVVYNNKAAYELLNRVKSNSFEIVYGNCNRDNWRCLFILICT